MRRVNPVTLLVIAVILSVPMLATLDPVSAGVAVALELALVPATGVPWRTLGRRLVPVVVFIPVAALSMLLYGTPGGQEYWHFGIAVVTENSVNQSVAISVRVLALGLPTILLFSGVDPTRLADGLAQVARLPSRFVIGALAGVRMMSLFVDDWRSMTLARRARGLGDHGVLRRSLSMAFVLLVFAVRRGTKLATAMEARGFGAFPTRSWARSSRLGVADPVAVAVALAIMAVSLGASIALGTFRFVGS
ncbi:energy-coupling factor transporter transmembrane protein EcfT [Mycetocola reblochoni]|uniref:Energy-coupling factor transporter transmembrane protein EcfT n=1 Tax=Mycetocola reblochoni TaxID=331618 RepID=A0A3L6ZQR6_9MICO|nr:energy-coupling factor transporter transmembrane component T [Mycetocola reblochoni]RLP70178.1 energy-coupling factor transporter transmembrane protein EcfT [Mycetocola reblochoni]